MREPSSSSCARDDVDLVGEVFDAAFSDARVQAAACGRVEAGHRWRARGSLICLPLTKVPFELLEIANDECFAAPAELGVLARDFGIVQLHGVRRSAPERDGGTVEPEASTLIAALDHEQRRHDEIPVRRPACDSAGVRF